MKNKGLHNSKLKQVIHYLIFLLFVGLIIVTIYWGIKIYKEDETPVALVVLFVPFIFLFCRIYMSIILLKYLPAKMTYDKMHFTITLWGNSTRYSWLDVSRVKIIRSNLSEILKLYDEEGTCIYSANNKTTYGYRDLEDLIMHNERTYDVNKIYLIF